MNLQDQNLAAADKAVADNVATRSKVASPITTVSPTVVTSKAATDDLNNITTQHSAIVDGINNQATIIANNKATADAQAAEKAKLDAQSKATADKLAIDKQNAETKAAALNAINVGDKQTLVEKSRTPYGANQNQVLVEYTDGTRKVVAKDTPVVGDTAQSNYDTAAQTELDKNKALQTKELNDYTTAAQGVSDTIKNIQNGIIPLNAGEQAQVAGLQQSFNQLIQQQQLENTNAQGLGNIRGYQKGAAEYDPNFQVRTIGSIVTAGINKVSDLNIKMASAVATLTQSFKNDDIKAIKDAWDIYNTASEKRQTTLQKTITDAQAQIKAAQDAKIKVQEDINKIAVDAKKGGADDATIKAISSSKSVADAVAASGDYLQTGTGIVGEYAYYKRDAMSRGLTPMSFDRYQTIDANRKLAVASAGLGGGNLNPKEAVIFNSIVDKYNKSPLVAALDRTTVLRDIVKNIKADPSNAAQQLNLAYGYIQALDTYQSSVREGELNLVNTIDSKAGQLKNWASQMTNGQIVRPEIAKQMAEAAQTLIDSIEGGAKRQQAKYQAQAKQNGTNVNNAFNDFMKVAGSTGSSIIQNEEQAKSTVDTTITEKGNTVLPSGKSLKDTIVSMFEIPGATNSDIVAWMKTNGYVQ